MNSDERTYAEMRDVARLFSAGVKRLALYGPPQRLARDRVGGLVISTAITHDCGPETAVIDGNGTYPVERYETAELAKAGHAAWVEKLRAGLVAVTQLGYGETIAAESIALVPMSEADAEAMRND